MLLASISMHVRFFLRIMLLSMLNNNGVNHASAVLKKFIMYILLFQEKFSDVVNWLKANATKAQNSAPDAGASFGVKKFSPEVANKENSFFGEKTGSTTVSTVTNFASSWNPGLFSNNQNVFAFGRSLTCYKYT